MVVSIAVLLASCSGGRSFSHDKFLTQKAALQGKAPLACDPGFISGLSLATSDRRIVQLAPWAHDAGLRLGDRVVTSNDDTTERLVVVDRDDQRLRIMLPCRSHQKMWETWQAMIEAGRRRDWAACIHAAEEVERQQGFAWSTVLFIQSFCTSQSGTSKWRETALYYGYALALLQEETYAGNLEHPVVRTYLLGRADALRQDNAHALAADFQAEFARRWPRSATCRLDVRTRPSHAQVRDSSFVQTACF